MRALILFLACSTFAAGLAPSSEDVDARKGINGTASWYGEAYRGRTMANGQPFDPAALTAASWAFPLGTRVRVTHAGRSVVVTITDRGPARRLHRRGRVIDLSEAAFARLTPTRAGLIQVHATSCGDCNG